MLLKEAFSVWNSDKSINLTHFFVRVFYALLAVLAIAAPFLIENESLNGIFSFANDLPKMYLIPFYISVPAGFAALVCLDKLLRNLKNEVVFNCLNVRLLRILSYCCFFAAAVAVLGGAVIGMKYGHLLFVYACAVLELFVGVIVRVVKNCFQKAVEIKSENDLTI